MEIGAWIGLSSLVISVGLGLSAYMSSRTTGFRQRIEDLEERLRECQGEVRRQRENNDWLMQVSRSYGYVGPRERPKQP